MKIESSCKGCLLVRLGRECELLHIKKILKTSHDLLKCPCTICLLKGICRSGCDNFIEYLVSGLTINKASQKRVIKRLKKETIKSRSYLFLNVKYDMLFPRTSIWI